jgi:neutral ceramidase
MHSDQRKPETFVAAFANANCGDVSGNVELGHVPDGCHDVAQMQKHGRRQFEVAERLFGSATEEVTGPVGHRHTRMDFSKVTTGAKGARTWPAALGLSFAAGSAVDSVPKPDLGIEEGRTAANLTEGDAIIAAAAHLALSAVFGISLIDQGTVSAAREGQLPKPVVLMPGIEQPPVVPQVLPVQLLRVGAVAVLGIPGELTTMAGRRLRTNVLGALSATGVTHLALGTYANEYAQYITTPEEYSAQHYEGASTLFGPHTLEAYQQVAAQLATAIAKGKPSPPGPDATPWTSPRQRRYRFRNLSSSAVRLRFYNKHDWLQWVPLPRGDKTIAAGAEVAYPEREFTWRVLPKIERVTVELPTVETVTVKVGNDVKRTMSAGQLLIISADGSISVGDYSPPPRT